MPPSLPSRVFGSFSVTGLLAGALFCAASLTPSLIPRTYVVQGVLAGVSLAVGYGVGNLIVATSRYLGMPDFVGRVKTVLLSVAAAFSLNVLIVFFWRSAEWQTSIRERMAMPPGETIRPLEVAGVTVVVFLALARLARLLMVVAGFFGQRSARFLPPRLARTVESHWRFPRRALGEVLRRAELPREIWRQHADILEAAVAGEADRAEAFAVDHDLRAADTLYAALADRAGGSSFQTSIGSSS